MAQLPRIINYNIIIYETIFLKTLKFVLNMSNTFYFPFKYIKNRVNKLFFIIAWFWKYLEKDHFS